MELTPWRPFEDAEKLYRRDLDTLRRFLGQTGHADVGLQAWRPSVDIRETEGGLVLQPEEEVTPEVATTEIETP